MGHLELGRALFREPLPPDPSASGTRNGQSGASPEAAAAAAARAAARDPDAAYWTADGAVLWAEAEAAAAAAAAAASQPPGATPALTPTPPTPTPGGGGTPAAALRPPLAVWHAGTVPDAWRWSAASRDPSLQLARAPPPRQTCCALELDACIDDILNRCVFAFVCARLEGGGAVAGWQAQRGEIANPTAGAMAHQTTGRQTPKHPF